MVVLVAFVSGKGAAVVFSVAVGIAIAVVGVFSRGIATGESTAVRHWRRPAMVTIAVVAMEATVVVASTGIDAWRWRWPRTIAMDRPWHVVGAVRRRVPLVLGPRVAAVIASVVRRGRVAADVSTSDVVAAAAAMVAPIHCRCSPRCLRDASKLESGQNEGWRGRARYFRGVSTTESVQRFQHAQNMDCLSKKGFSSMFVDFSVEIRAKKISSASSKLGNSSLIPTPNNSQLPLPSTLHLTLPKTERCSLWRRQQRVCYCWERCMDSPRPDDRITKRAMATISLQSMVVGPRSWQPLSRTNWTTMVAPLTPKEKRGQRERKPWQAWRPFCICLEEPMPLPKTQMEQIATAKRTKSLDCPSMMRFHRFE